MKLEKTATSYALSIENAQLRVIIKADHKQEEYNDTLSELLDSIEGVYDTDYDGLFAHVAIYFSVQKEHDNNLTQRKVADTVQGYIDRKGAKT